MSRLTLYRDDNPHEILIDTQDGAEIAKALNAVGVVFERWSASATFAKDAPDSDVLAAYAGDIDRIKAQGGYQTVDILRCNAETPNKPAIRAKFLDEHTHSEDEVRFFVEGAGVFYLRLDGKVYMTLCEREDLISVPAGTSHWFDMGPEPDIAAIRFFNTVEGWVPNYTGSDIAATFPKFESSSV